VVAIVTEVVAVVKAEEEAEITVAEEEINVRTVK
jgi:hypothetical protein